MVALAVISLFLPFIVFLLLIEPLALVSVNVVGIAMLWPWFAKSAKRWHDQNKSGV
jgi:uncharacterized membrane protein YhaH (DUF805 family)